MPIESTLHAAFLQGMGLARSYGGLVRSAGQDALHAADRYVPATACLQGMAQVSRNLPGVSRLCQTAGQIQDEWRASPLYLQSVLAASPRLQSHAQWLELFQVITAPTAADVSGFPIMTPRAYRTFRDGIPHLFREGLQLLDWLDELDRVIKEREERGGIDECRLKSMRLASQALRTMTFTAAVTAPSDLWLAHQILATHKKLGIFYHLQDGKVLNVADYAAKCRLDPHQLSHDLGFLYVRGFIDRTEEGYKRPRDHVGWAANAAQVSLGYHVMETVLSLKARGALNRLKAGDALAGPAIFEDAGLTRNGRVTILGARLFERGPGPMGIIGAYRTYLVRHAELLKVHGARPHVERGPNIFASRDANRANFEKAVEQLSHFCRDRGFRPRVFIEHALGLGQAIQIFTEKLGMDGVQFVGADYEDTPLAEARKRRDAGELPANTQFVQADIGKPEMLIDFMRGQGIDPKGSVMIVGNGFHEVRGQTTERMIEVFRRYSEAGILVIFIEESGLTDRQIRDSAWNTYHAGFRWAHRTSGQGLRPPFVADGDILSWHEAATRGGYDVVDQYTQGTRPIFPVEMPREENPPISVTFFCVPKAFSS